MVIGIVTLLGGLGIFLGVDAYRNYSLNQERDAIVAILQRARGESLNNIDALPHGVHFGDDEYVLFSGDLFSALDSRNQIFPINPGIEISGLNEVLFSQLSGNAHTTGDITIGNGIRSMVISINNEGRIAW